MENINNNYFIFSHNGYIGISDIAGNIFLNPDKYIFPKLSGGGMLSEKFAFSDGIVCVSSTDGKIGYIDPEGNTAIPFLYESASLFHTGRAAVKKNGKWGIIDLKGNIRVPFIYDAILYNENVNLKDERICAVKDGHFGYITPEGEEAIPFIFDNHVGKCSGEFHDGIAPVIRDGKKFFIEYNGTKIITPCEEFDYISNYTEGYAQVIRFSENNKMVHGYLGKDGKLAVPVRYEQIGGRFSDGVLAVSFSESIVYTDVVGKIVLEVPYETVTDFSCGIAWGRKNGIWESFNKKGKIVFSGLTADYMFPCGDEKWIFCEKTEIRMCGFARTIAV